MTCWRRSRLNPRKWQVQAQNTKAARAAAALGFSAAKPQSLDELLVLLGLRGSEVIEELAALVHHLDEPAPRGMITLVRGEVLAEAIDALGQQRHLYFRGAGVGWCAAELRENPALFLAGYSHGAIILTTCLESPFDKRGIVPGRAGLPQACKPRAHWPRTKALGVVGTMRSRMPRSRHTRPAP